MERRGGMRRWLAVTAVLAATASSVAVLTGTGPASAAFDPAVVTFTGRQLTFKAAEGTPNHVEFSGRPSALTIRDTFVRVVLDSGSEQWCSNVDDHTVQCAVEPPAQSYRLEVFLGDGNDRFSSTAQRCSGCKQSILGEDGNDELGGGSSDELLNGGRGDDWMSGGSGADTLNGADGKDRLFGSFGRDTVSGGKGDDELWGGSDDDRLDGDAGRDDVHGGTGDTDTVAYFWETGAVTVRLDDQANDGPAGEGDNIHADIDEVIGGKGPDLLVGNDGPNILRGWDGNDTLQGRGGDDTLDVQGGEEQWMYGGAGTDVCVGYGKLHQYDCEL